MRLLFDARKIFDGGIGRYIRNNITGLLGSGGALVKLGLIVKKGEESDVLKFISNSRLKGDEKVYLVTSLANCYSLEELFFFQSSLSYSSIDKPFVWSDFDVFHTPHYVLPFGIKIPSVVTIHDLIHITHPEKSYYPFIARSLIKSAVKRANSLLTVSEASKEVLIKYFPKSHDKTNVVLNCLDSSFTANEKLSETSYSKKKFFLAVVSDDKPHKGIDLLIDGYKGYASKSKSPIPLYLLGKGSSALSKQRNQNHNIVAFGRVSEDELISMYQNALALIVTSYSEGFCLPIIEAHSQGTPVISTPFAAAKELLTEHDILLPDFNYLNLSYALRDCSIRNLSSNYVRPTFDMQKYNIDYFSNMHINVYRNAIGEAKLGLQNVV